MKREVDLYVVCLAEIKDRLDFVRIDYVNPASVSPVPVMKFEGACLQVRKVVELVAFASLVSNRTIYEREWTAYAKENDFSKLVKRLSKINTNFLPTSVAISGRDMSGHWSVTDSETQLDADVLIKLYGGLGNVLHARNPYTSAIDWPWYQSFVARSVKSIISCLQNHVAILATGEHILVQMMNHGEPIRPFVLRER